MKCVTVYGCLTPQLCNSTRKCTAAMSERASPKPAGPAKVVGSVATCSLPASSVLALIERWGNNAAQWESDVKYHKRPIFKDDPTATISVASCEARASIYALCIQDIRAEMARANKRQPEENTQVTNAGANTKNSQQHE